MINKKSEKIRGGARGKKDRPKFDRRRRRTSSSNSWRRTGLGDSRADRDIGRRGYIPPREEDVEGGKYVCTHVYTRYRCTHGI